MECFLNQVLLTLTIYWESKPRGKRVCVCGESVRETIDEAILTYKREVEKMNEKVEQLERNYM